MTPRWIDRARAQLLELRRDHSCWSYGPRTAPAIEPTALAGLALLAIGEATDSAVDPIASSAAGWLAARRHADGSLGVTVDLAEPGWATPSAILLWSALGAYRIERGAAVRWLLGLEGRPGIPTKDDPVGHDGTLIGWPWVAGTHSWVEPTAMALLALGREHLQEHPRVLEGARLLRDRAIPGGGWNLGNPVVFKTPLRPLPGPTGMALLALSKVDGPGPEVAEGLAYLQTMIGETLAPASLGWSILGLRAWRVEPSSAPERLALSYERMASRGPSATDLSLLLLAAGARALDLLSITPTRKGAAHAP